LGMNKSGFVHTLPSGSLSSTPIVAIAGGRPASLIARVKPAGRWPPLRSLVMVDEIGNVL
jgi:hypothetical protein